MNKKSIFEMFRLNFMSRLYIRILFITLLFSFVSQAQSFISGYITEKTQTNPFPMFISLQKTMKAHLVI